MGCEAVVHHLTEDQKRGVGHLIEVCAHGPFSGGSNDGALLGQAAFGNHGNWQVAFSEVNQVRGNFAQPSAPHEHDKRRGGAEGLQEVVCETAVLACRGSEPRRRGHATQGQRDARQAGKRRPGGDARHVGPGKAELVGEGQFFACPPKHHRVAAFQPHDEKALPCTFFNPVVDEGLGGAGLAGTLAHTNFRCARRCQVQNVLVHQAVIEHEIGLFDRACAFESQELGVARPGTHQPKVGLSRREVERCGHVKRLLRCWVELTARRVRPKTCRPC